MLVKVLIMPALC